MLKLGVTGGIGTGKTTVCEILKDLGCFIFSADIAAKEVQEKNQNVIAEIKQLFGDDIYQNGLPNRKRIAEVVFTDNEKLQRLNAIVHPAVQQAFSDALETAHLSNHRFIIKEAAIMFESGSEKGLDAVIIVAAGLETRLQRLEARGITKEDAIKRMKNQLSQEALLEKSKYVIWNDEDLEHLRYKTKVLFETVIKDFTHQ